MSNKQRIAWYATLFVAGITAVVLGVLEVTSSYVAGLGGAFAGVAVIRLIREVKYARDPAYAQRVEAVNNDERLAFLASKSAEASFKISVIGLAVLSIVLQPLGYHEASSVLSMVMAVELTLYWVNYLILSKRY